MTKTELEWGRQQSLFRAAPGHVIFNPNSGFHEMVLPWRASADHATNPHMVRQALAREFQKYRIPPVEANALRSMALDLRTLDPEGAVIDTTLFPTAFFCNLCGKLISDDPGTSAHEIAAAARKLSTRIPPGARCYAPGCNGFLLQWNLLTVHECGETLHLPTFWMTKCPDHGFEFLHFDRHNSERSSDWEIVCHAPGCRIRKGRTLFFSIHKDCELTRAVPDSGASFSTSPIQKATNFMAKVIPILNSDQADRAPVPGTPVAEAIALGALRASGYFRHYSPNAGLVGWRQEYNGSTNSQDPSRRKAIELAKKIENETLRGQLLRELQDEPVRSGILNDLRFKMLVEDPEYLREATDLSIYLDERRSQGVDDLLQDPTLPEVSFDSLQQAKTMTEAMRIAVLRHVEDIAVTSCLAGFTRGDYDPGKVILRLYWNRTSGRNVSAIMYTNTVRTEGILVQLQPSATLRWLAKVVNEGVPVSGEFTPDLHELQRRLTPESLRPFEPPTVPWTYRHYGLLHTMSHLFLRNLAKFSGSEQEGLSEVVYPYQNAFLCYANQSVEFSLEGLGLAFEHHLPEILQGVLDDTERCPYNPECETKSGACHGCVHIAEFSCAFFNRALDRRWLAPGASGFWGTT